MTFARLSLAGLALLAAAASYAEPDDRGQLAQAIYDTAIHLRPSGYSPICMRVPKDMRLVIRPAASGYWSPVLLTNGTFGYVPKDALQVFPYEYKITRTYASRNNEPLMSRGAARTDARAFHSALDSSVAAQASNFLGVPYKWGGNDTSGIDCSGLVKKLFGEVGVGLPRTAAEQAGVGTPVTRLENLLPGDRLYFWEAKRGKIGHTGIYVGGGYFIHASHGHGQVAREYLGQAKWLRILVAARRT